MITRIMTHSLKRHHEMAMYLYYLGMVSVDQLAVLFGNSEGTVRALVHQFNNSTPGAVTSHRPAHNIRSRRLKKPLGPHMYSLGPGGKRIIEDFLGHQFPYRENSGAQYEHYYGINNILIHFIKALGYDDFLDRADWLNGKDARKILVRAWKDMNIAEDQKLEVIKTMILPDARAEIDGMGYWIEYDNDTESPDDLREKLRKYCMTLVPIQNDDPIIWVAPTERRAKKLAAWYAEIQKEPHYVKLSKQPGFYFPDMVFITSNQLPDLVQQLIKNEAVS